MSPKYFEPGKGIHFKDMAENHGFDEMKPDEFVAVIKKINEKGSDEEMNENNIGEEKLAA